MELVPLYPNEIDDIVPQTQEKKKKKKKRNNDDDDSNPEEEAEENAANGGKKAKRRGPARMFALRSTLPNDLIRKAVKTIEDMSPENQARYEKDLHGALGDAFAGNRQEPDEELKEWKMNDDTIFDWKTGPDQRTLIGILYVILSLILVNERVLTDGERASRL